MSFLLTRPPKPVPGTAPRSMLFSRAIRRTNGDDRTGCPAGAAGGGDEGRAIGVGAAGTATGSGARGAGWAGTVGPEAPGAPAPPMTATTVLTWTVVPSLTLISRNTPAEGAGISASTLSVEISNRGSSRWTLLPTFFSHFVMVPSKIDSPICGMTTSLPRPLGAAAPPPLPAVDCMARSLTGGCSGVEVPLACGADLACGAG